MANLSRQEAFDFVNSIRINNGGIEESDRKNTPKNVLESIASLKRQLAASTEILAVELYSKPTRFVYELIQNAEDNEYKTARQLDSEPFLRFCVSQKKIIIDSNEDGFSKDNVNAICKVRTSTKKGIRGYIGEKGIGFKSVFTVASKVHVQSGPFAFYFNYEGDDDDGLGLVTPFNGEHGDLPHDVRTRFTLTLKNDIDYGSLVKDFNELPDTLLLFLRTLRRLQVIVQDDKGSHDRRYEYLYQETIGKGLLVKYSNEDKRKNLRFVIRKKTVYNLPSDRARKNIQDAEVVLAFPVDDNDLPVIAPQHVYAYLPLRKIGFPFQIQSDFITQASREDVLDSDWNKALRTGAAEVFVDALTYFLRNPILQYQWPYYLPNDAIVDPFWAQLKELIASRVKNFPILRTDKSGALKCVGQLRFLPDQFRDEEGEPLFEDLPNEIYLSDLYSGAVVSILRTIGLESINLEEFWDRLKADLRSTSSRIKSSQTSAAWHSSSARVILYWANSSPRYLEQVQAFEMLPLRGGSWTSIKSGPVFYHDIDGIDIPLDLGLRILDPKAAAHPTRKKLFDAIGVNYCDPGFVKKLIVGKYAKWNNVGLASSVSHLRFLFHLCPENEQPVDKTMFLFDIEKNPIYRIRVALGRSEMIIDDIYLDIPGTYNVRAICLKSPSTNPFNIHIIHPAYMEFEEAKSASHSLSWKSWLRKYAGVLHSPRLLDTRDPSKLSPLFDWIVRKRSDILLGVLKTHWSTYKELSGSSKISSNSPIVETLQKVKLHCKNGQQSSLQDAFIPLEGLVMRAAELGAVDDIRFLQLPCDVPEASPEHWGFLSTFGTGAKEDLGFYLESLRAISSRKRQDRSEQRPTLIKIYEAIEKRANVDDYPRLRKFFEIEQAINAKCGHVQSPGPYSWFRLHSCVFQGPDFLTTHNVLANHEDFRKSIRCNRLFTSVLQIPDANWLHTLGQISYEKSKLDCSNASEAKTRMSHIYHALSSNSRDGVNWECVSERFEREGLVYIPFSGWHSPSKCIWSGHTFLPGIFPIASHYSNLKTFFVEHLKVQSPTLQSQLKELQSLCSQQNVSEKFSNIRNLMKEISCWKPNSQDVQQLLDKTIIPVIDEHGYEQLVKPKDTFAIVDRQRYGDMFRGKIAVLAVALGELRSLENFLSALDLDTRYMSRLVSETSEVENSFADTALSEEFRKRASALVRCAVHFENPEIGNDGVKLYRLLRRAIVYQSDEISKTVNLELNGRDLTVRHSEGTFHIQSDESNLRLYVPKIKKTRRICYVTQIPGRLASHWSISNANAKNIISNILNVEVEDLSEVLIDLGIPEIPGLAQHADDDSDEEGGQSDIESFDQVLRTPNTRPFSKSPAPTTPSVSGRFAFSASVTPAPTQTTVTTPDSRSLSLPRGRRLEEAEEIFTQLDDYTTQYTLLLDKVISAGKEGDFPTNFGFASSRSNIAATLVMDPDTIFGVRSRDMMAHDMRIGAAGELYAFEVLQYHLDSFDPENWRSTIRHHVSKHKKYSDLAPWTGRETADIVYEDHDSQLTRLLIAYGYLPFQVWAGETPTYYLEVKTTTGPRDTRFFMSKAQVRRMRDMRLEPDRASAEIYIILRVYNLTGDNIGMRILLDPATLEREGRLVVEAEQYTVLQPSGAGVGGG